MNLFKIKMWLIRRRWDRYWREQNDINWVKWARELNE